MIGNPLMKQTLTCNALQSLDFNGAPDYREKFEKEMQEIRDLEIWRAGKAVRSLRPENAE